MATFCCTDSYAFICFVGHAATTGDEKEDIALLFPKFFKLAPHWKIAVVSGTADAAVPFLGTERWMECLSQPVLEDWQLWYMNDDVAVRCTSPLPVLSSQLLVSWL